MLNNTTNLFLIVENQLSHSGKDELIQKNQIHIFVYFMAVLLSTNDDDVCCYQGNFIKERTPKKIAGSEGF